MICRVRRVWTGEKRVTVILVEEGQTKETQAFLWLPEEQLQAALCERVEKQFASATCPRFVVQLAPPERFSGHHIEVMEMIHEPRKDRDEPETERQTDPFAQDHIETIQYDFDRAHGMTRRILR